MVAKNDITGDSIQSRTSTKAYQDNYDLIFRKKHDNGTMERGTATQESQEASQKAVDQRGSSPQDSSQAS